MRFVQQATIRPARCAANSSIPGNHRDGFIDTGGELPGFDNHVYVSVVMVREMARMIGWSGPEELQAERDARDAAERALAKLEAEADRLRQVVDAVDVMESADFRARRKPGRKPVKEPEGAGV